jgi:hypothetical protein
MHGDRSGGLAPRGRVVAGAGSGQPRAADAKAHAAAVPPALLRELAALDAKLRAPVRAEAAGERLDFAELKRELEAAHATTRGLTKHFGSNDMGKLGGRVQAGLSGG